MKLRKGTVAVFVGDGNGDNDFAFTLKTEEKSDFADTLYTVRNLLTDVKAGDEITIKVKKLPESIQLIED